jgi:hypothetical protein
VGGDGVEVGGIIFDESVRAGLRKRKEFRDRPLKRADHLTMRNRNELRFVDVLQSFQAVFCGDCVVNRLHDYVQVKDPPNIMGWDVYLQSGIGF